jgi:hypothetical protein
MSCAQSVDKFRMLAAKSLNYGNFKSGRLTDVAANVGIRANSPPTCHQIGSARASARDDLARDGRS